VAHGLPDRREPVYRALPAELFGGTAGVALFLAQVNAAAPDRRIRQTALAAARQALARTADIPTPDAIGLFTGTLGVAHSVAVCGRELGVPQLTERALAITTGARGREHASPHLDLVSGRSGAILALLALGREAESPDLVDWAVSLGDELLSACLGERGWQWPEVLADPARTVRTGLSHGVSGAALALTELFAATGESRFLAAAGAAIDDERRFFDPNDGNWRRREPGEPGQASQVAWCHGAPGIGLARLRAWQLTGDPRYREELTVCVTTTSRWIGASLRSGVGNFSLCHGLGGNAEMLALCVDQNAAEGGLADLVAQVADAGIERYADSGRPWPCGTPGGETPGLMLGLAGIGLFYLRANRPEVASALYPVARTGGPDPSS
jgi:lantibiotic modifying enzyme